MRRRGFTLVEMVMVIVIMGLVFAMVLPRMRDASLKQSLRGSRNTLQGLYMQARLAAVQQTRTAGLQFVGDRVFVTGTPRTDGAGGYDTIGKVRDFANEFGVTITPDGTPISIDSKGITRVTTEVKIKLAKAGKTDSLTILPYGRIRK